MLDELFEKQKNMYDLKWQHHYFTFVIESNGKIYYEPEIFVKIVQLECLHSLVVHFLYNVFSWSKLNSNSVWSDDEYNLGLFAAYSLSMHSQKYINLYSDMILVCDMNHECFQEQHIDNLIQKYGLVPEIVTLLSYRVSECTGQHGWEQLNKYKSELVEHFGKNKTDLDRFLKISTSLTYKFYARTGAGKPWFDQIETIAEYLPSEIDRREWLDKQEKDIIWIFGSLDNTSSFKYKNEKIT
jgi:hypothetical protein